MVRTRVTTSGSLQSRSPSTRATSAPSPSKKDGGRDAVHPERAPRRHLLVDEDRERGEVVVVVVVAHELGPAAVERERQDHQLVAELPLQGVHGRHLGPAGEAPRGPEVHGDGRAAIVGQAPRFAGLVEEGDGRWLHRPVGHHQVEHAAPVAALIQRAQRLSLRGDHGAAQGREADDGDGCGEPPEDSDTCHGRCSSVSGSPVRGHR